MNERSGQPIRHFTDLVVWQNAFRLGVRVFDISKKWPAEERFALTDQIRRASRSVSGNIAEAWGKRRYEAHFVSKLSDSDGELHETENWLLFAREHGYVSAEIFEELTGLAHEVGRMLGSMMQNPGPFVLRVEMRPH